MSISRHVWDIGEWPPLVLDGMLQYLYELDYHFDSPDGTAPRPVFHVFVLSLGDYLGIEGLKVTAADKFESALSLFNNYGSKVGFTISYFKELLVTMQALWDWDATDDWMKALRNRVSMHLRQNISEWGKKKGSKSRFLESMYGLIFRETEQENPNFTVLMETVRKKYLKYLDTEIGYEGICKDLEASVSSNKPCVNGLIGDEITEHV